MKSTQCNYGGILFGNESGSAMVFAIMILAVLTIIGISSITTSTIESKIDRNDRLHKIAFYNADGGTEIAREMIEQNLSCPAGFATEPLTIGSLVVEDRLFAYTEDEPTDDYPSDTIRDLRFPADNSLPRTNIVAFGRTRLAAGSAVQMAAGYEGKGKGAAGLGAEIVYNIVSQTQGSQNSGAGILTRYRHKIGQEGNCKY